ncbi:acetyl-CoA carboxylase biotin carboxyl carrier protein subunit [Leptotrichia sp. OH3620_COT-345]|uniref:acetyl-CoA carboxylase biotin carboxyl carrier protein subunit n=1 Tax=Leptotrichia sp. OH3620_COT-345 TaxID=2491048 RepID=UPI000F655087|nr:acetyl-CoA carboxylase biotin carboxyl carrier protein subunit [Leptotrichia sp. OH3620_COT-345]RRD38892.1 acetyl-CoA carboxylase biotin carboxyl carrier protein subunit [Leptotrichia sp. OH3620_COT-345]
MELRDIKELMKILKQEEMAEMKVRYGKIKLVLTNSEISSKETPQETKRIGTSEKIESTIKEEVIKSRNVGEIILERLEKGMEVYKGMKLAKIRTIGIDTDVKSNVDGILKEILISDQSTVDYAKSLFVIEVL